MLTDLTISLMNRPGSLATASDVLGRSGINIEGACGFVCGDHGEYHVLVSETERARRKRARPSRSPLTPPRAGREAPVISLMTHGIIGSDRVDLLERAHDRREIARRPGRVELLDRHVFPFDPRVDLPEPEREPEKEREERNDDHHLDEKAAALSCTLAIQWTVPPVRLVSSTGRSSQSFRVSGISHRLPPT